MKHSILKRFLKLWICCVSFHYFYGLSFILCDSESVLASYNNRLNTTVNVIHSVKLGTNLIHLLVYRDIVYIGVHDQIFQLNSTDLTEIAPKIDINIIDSETSSNTVNIIKILLAYEDKLVICGSFKGKCATRNLTNISKPENIVENVVDSNEDEQTVAFISSDDLRGNRFYKMLVTTDGSGGKPEFSSHALTKNRGEEIFQIKASETFRNASYLDSVHYIFGFGYDSYPDSYSYSYLIATENKSSSKLIQINETEDVKYRHKILTLECKKDDAVYNLAKVAFSAKAGLFLQKQLNFTDKNKINDVLYVVFSKSKDIGHANKSALCIYSLQDIENHFSNGYVSKLAKPAAIFDEELTAIVATEISGISVAFAGTIDGHLKKLSVQSNRAEEYADIAFDQNSPIIRIMRSDSNDANLYLMTEDRVSKIAAADNCSKFLNCSDCFEAKVPYCGWCPSSKSCTFESECKDENNSTVSWKNFYWDESDSCNSASKQPTELRFGFSPKMGPYDAPTVIQFDLKIIREFENIIDRTMCEIVKNKRVHCRMPPINDTYRPPFNNPLPERRLLFQEFVTAVVSTETFQYVDPSIVDIKPKFGTIFGGTNITITGDYLNLGDNSTFEVKIGNSKCENAKRFEKLLTCQIEKTNHSVGLVNVIIKIANVTRSLTNAFDFKPNPNITSVSSNKIDEKLSPRGTPTGGTKIYVKETNLNVAQNIKFVVYGENELKTDCDIQDETHIICYSPAVGVNKSFDERSDPQEFECGFVFDNDPNNTQNCKKNFNSGRTNSIPRQLYIRYFYYLQWKKFVHQFKTGRPNSIDEKLELNEQAHLMPYDPSYEISNDELDLTEEKLGGGAYGIIYKGFWRNAPGNEKIVAVKESKSDQTLDLRALEKEIKILIHLGKHPNLVRLLGAVTDNLENNRELKMILEICPHGNIRDVLRKKKLNFNFSSNENYIKSKGYTPFDQIGGNTNTVSKNDMLWYAIQVAFGMEHMLERKILHCDLAARNILLFDNDVVKICDFGLAAHFDKNNYWRPQEKNNYIPYLWMAPESLLNSKFTSMTDVWSFGIVLWEFFSFGDLPDYNLEISTKDAIRSLFLKLNNGTKLTKPTYATENIYDIMKACWKLNPKQRPSFSDLRERILNVSDGPINMERWNKHKSIEIESPYFPKCEDDKNENEAGVELKIRN